MRGRDQLRLAAVAAVVACAAVWAGCEVGIPAGREPHYEFNYTDMGDQPKVKPQRGALEGVGPWGMYEPPRGAVAVDEYPYHYAQADAAAAAERGPNPLPATPEVLAEGKWVYDNYCVSCHGAEGAGDGKVAKLFPAPPSLLRQVPREYTDARVFHVPMRGQGSMPSHAKQIEPEEIWAVVHYIRALQAAQPVAPPTQQDLEAAGKAAGKAAGEAAGQGAPGDAPAAPAEDPTTPEPTTPAPTTPEPTTQGGTP